MPATPPGTREALFAQGQSRGESESRRAVVTRGKGWALDIYRCQRLRNVLSPLVGVFVDGVQFPQSQQRMGALLNLVLG